MTLSYHDLSPIRQIDSEQINMALSRAMRMRTHDNRDARPDLAMFARHVDSLAMGELSHARRMDATPGSFALAAGRVDALGAGAPGFPRDFEYVRQAIIEEKRQPLTAMEYFPIDGSVPLGARRHTSRRSVGAGEAQIHRGGSEIPRARNAYVEESYGVAYVVCSVDVNFFDALSTDWAGLQQYSRDLRLATRCVEERLNRIAWYGDAAAGLAGVLNHPHLAKTVLPVSFTDAAVSEDVATALHDLVNTPMISSVGVFYPTEILVSPRIHAFLFSRKHSTQGGTDMSIGEFFLKGQTASGSGIQRIRMAPELAGIGPAGTADGILAFRPDLDSIGHVLLQGPTTLPVYQSSPLDQTTVVFAATGGIVMADAGNAILGYVDPT